MAFRSESRAYDAVYDPVFTASGYRGAPSTFDPAACTGAGRYRYFQRPMVPHLDAVAPGVLLAPSRAVDPLAPAVSSRSPRVRETSSQTMYRESEAQTVPYSPEYVIPEGTNPEILMLRGLSHERGLPVGEHEVLMIQHAQKKHLLEASLPPATDEASLFLRRKLLELQELREFALRQREMDEAHALRLETLREALLDRDQDAEFVREQRVEALRAVRLDERDAALEVIQAQRIKVLRKLSMARSRLKAPQPAKPVSGGTTTGSSSSSANTTKNHKASAPRARTRDVIGEYATYSSRVYAPVARTGQRPDKDCERYDVAQRVMSLADHGLMRAIEQEGLPRHLTETRLARDDDDDDPSQPPPPPPGPNNASSSKDAPRARTFSDRHKQQLAADLLQMTNIFEAKKRRASTASQQKNTPNHPEEDAHSVGSSTTQLALQQQGQGDDAKELALLPSWRTRVSKAERPATPRCRQPDEAAEELEAALRLVQRLLRGRAAQNAVLEGKERRLELIKELRAADAAEAASQRDSEADAAFAREHAALAALERRERVSHAALECMAGEAAASTLDLLSKEMVRREAKERLLSLATRADAERRQRECEEGGRRQAEERFRARCDDVYASVTAENLAAARTLVDEIIASGLEDVAAAQALGELPCDDQRKDQLRAAMRGAAAEQHPASTAAPAAAPAAAPLVPESAAAAPSSSSSGSGGAPPADDDDLSHTALFAQQLVAQVLTPRTEQLQAADAQQREAADAQQRETHQADAAQTSPTPTDQIADAAQTQLQEPIADQTEPPL